MFSRLLPVLVLPSLLFFHFLPRGPSGLPSLGDEPLASELAPRHHASRTTAHILLSHLSAITCPPHFHAPSQKGRTIWPWDLARVGEQKGEGVWPEGQSDGGYEDVETLGKMDQDAQEDVCRPRR